MSVVTKRSTMTFFSHAVDHYSHRVRIVLAEKGVTVEVVDVDPAHIPRDLSESNPYNSLPTLIDRGLTIYESRVMMEYLDERFPHPPLLPVYPVARAEIRQFIYRVETDWCPWVDSLVRGDSGAGSVRKELADSLTAVAPIFAEKPYFMSADFTLVDCCLAPILWRLEQLQVPLAKTRHTAPLWDYMRRVFSRDSFQASLTAAERAMPAVVTEQ